MSLHYSRKIRIRKVDDKKAYLDLLLLADEQDDMIEKYLSRGVMYILEDDGEVKGECVVTDEGNGILEIQNIAVGPEYQGKGYGRALIEYVAEHYRNKFCILQAGTGESPLTVPFYERCGFTRYDVQENYFPKYYDHPIFEGGIQLKDRIVFRREL